MSVTSSPKVRKATIAVDFTRTGEWLKQHRHEYVGSWVVLDGDGWSGSAMIHARLWRRRELKG